MSEEDYKKVFSQNLKMYLSVRKKQPADIVNDLNIPFSTVSGWINGIKMPRMGNVETLARYLGVEKSDLLEKKDGPRAKAISLPVLGRVAAGIPLDAIEEIIDWEEVPEELTRDGEYFCLQIHGDSMEPRICDGDVVVVRKQSDADDGDLVIALINGDDAVCKRLKKYATGIALVSNNPAYQPMYYSYQDTEEIPVKVIGKVKELRGKF